MSPEEECVQITMKHGPQIVRYISNVVGVKLEIKNVGVPTTDIFILNTMGNVGKCRLVFLDFPIQYYLNVGTLNTYF